MMEKAQREPQVHGRNFILGGCLGVRGISPPGAPWEFSVGQAEPPFDPTMAETEFTCFLPHL